jgi:ABC1 atypical kinase-like domain
LLVPIHIGTDCDPHPGNLLRTTDGKLCILDFGMVTRLDKNLQLTLIEHMAHLTSADYAELPRDLLLLGFVPEDKADVIGDSGVVELLAEIYGAWTSGGGVAAINVNKVIAQLQDLTAQKGNLFRIPPYFAYIAKSFSVLEGIGLSNDPKYSIINECLPYVSKRLLTDKDRMGPALSTFIFGPDKANADRIVDYKRVEQLVEGFGEYSTSASGALLGKENISRSILLEEAADQVLDLVFTEEETPLQQIVLEQMAKIISATSRTVWTELRERSGMLPSGRTRLGTLIDPLGLWRTSPLVRTNELDEKTVETTQKLIDLMRRQVQDSDNPLFNALSREDTLQFASILVRKVWAKRSGVVQTSSRFARILLQLTADQLERGERDSRRLPLRRIPPSTADSTATPEAATTGSGLSSTPSLPSSSSPETSQRLQGARRLLEEVRQHQQEVTSQPTLVSTGAKPESNRLAGARKMLRDLQNDDA